MNNTSFEYHYFIKDHLGNVRAVLSETADRQPYIVQASSYYPFGMLFQNEQVQAAQGTGANRYLYNGKETQKMPGGWYDYGARFYDDQLGRWHVGDPMAEKYTTLSPFAYCANSPVNLVDFNGMTYGEANIENADAQFKDNGWDEMNKEKDNPPEWLNALARLFTGTSGDINAPKEANIPKETRKMSKISGTVNDINKVTEATAEGIKTLAKKNGKSYGNYRSYS